MRAYSRICATTKSRVTRKNYEQLSGREEINGLALRGKILEERDRTALGPSYRLTIT